MQFWMFFGVKQITGLSRRPPISFPDLWRIDLEQGVRKDSTVSEYVNYVIEYWVLL